MTWPHTSPPTPDTSAPTCPGCDQRALVGTFPAGVGRLWWCARCLNAECVRAYADALAERARAAS